eukprot:COSAG01_NODE_39971_length_469_cov_1.856757_1_plen_97_part_01
MPASASGQLLPSCGYLPARLQPWQTASQLIPLSPLLPVWISRAEIHWTKSYILLMHGKPTGILRAGLAVRRKNLRPPQQPGGRSSKAQICALERPAK